MTTVKLMELAAFFVVLQKKPQAAQMVCGKSSAKARQ